MGKARHAFGCSQSNTGFYSTVYHFGDANVWKLSLQFEKPPDHVIEYMKKNWGIKIAWPSTETLPESSQTET